MNVHLYYDPVKAAKDSEELQTELQRIENELAGMDFRKTTAKILDIYRRRDTIEKSFDNLKNDLDMHRLHTHNDETAEGKVFCAFLSLVVLFDMMNCLSEYMSEHKLTFQKILLELRKVKCSVSASGLYTLLNPPSKTVKDIFSLLNISSLGGVCIEAD